MRKKIVSIFVCMLLCVTVLSVTGTANINGGTSGTTRTPGDILIEFDAQTANTNEAKNYFENNAPLTRVVLFEDGFETYEDWLIDFPPWTTIDVNGDPTFGHSAVTWPHQWEAYAFIIFNPSTTTPPLTEPEAQPHSGDKYCAGFNNDNAGYTNDDWLISPQLGPANYDEVTFWAKSYSDMYNYELFEVSVSTTDTNPASFTVISPVESPGHTAWEEFSYNLDAYDGESIYIGIHMISVDSWYLMIDDFSVTGALGPTVDAGGPYEGVVGEGIQFTGSATGGTPPYTWHWDFGNGDTADEQNPVYAYNEVGVYDVTLTVTDSLMNTGDDMTTATITGPELDIGGITGGLFKVKAVINNDGAAATGVHWKIILDGGAFIGKETNGENLSIAAGGSETVTSSLIVGFGSTMVTVETWIPDGPSDMKEQDGFVFLIFIKVNPGGG